MIKKALQNSHNFSRKLLSRTNLQKAGYVMVILFCLAMFLGKAASNITGAALFVVWSYYTICFNRNLLSTHPYLKWFLFPVVTGLFLGFFSDSGPLNSLQYLNQFKFMILPLPLAAFVTRTRQLNQALFAIGISAMISVSYGLFTMEGNLFGFFHGFQKLGRCADALMLVNLVLFTFLFLKKKNLPYFPWHVRAVMTIFFTVFMWAMVMTGIRGAWMAFSLVVMLGALFFRRSLIPILLIMILISLATLNRFSPNLYFQITTEIYSIVTVFTDVSPEKKRLPQALAEQNNGLVNPLPYESNSIRRHIMKAGFDFAKERLFFGTGVKNTRGLFIDFFTSRPDEYQKRFYLAKIHSKDFHNSYLQLIIETGIFAAGLFLLSLGVLTTKLIQTLGHCAPPEKTYILASLLGCCGFAVAQLFHTDLFSYGGKIFFFTLFMGCFFMEICHAKQTDIPKSSTAD